MALATAIFGTLTAYYGYQNNQLQSQVQTVGGQVTSAVSSAAVAQTQNAAELQAAQSSIADLQGQNQSLSSLLAAQTSAAPPQTSAAPATSADLTAGPLRHQGPITIALGGEYIDLDAPATDPKWGATSEGSGITNSLNYWLDANIHTSSNVDWVRTTEGETADYTTCSAKTGWAQSLFVPRDNVTDKAKYCLRTNSGRYATLRMLSKQGNTITIEITVWEAAS